MNLKSNPGGNIPVDDIIGRDELCQFAWETLKVQSLLLRAERRIGKTCVLRKMAAMVPEGWVIVLRDVENCHTASDFVSAVYKDIEQYLSRWRRTAQRARTLLIGLGGTEVGGIIKLPAGRDIPWKRLLTQAIEDMVEEQQDSKLVFFWDEIPFMLQAISSREGENVAMEVLDVLRALRQTYTAFRVVFTGSIGMHHVISALKNHGYANSPINDLYTLEVSALSSADACHLACALLTGEQIACDALTETSVAIADVADNIAFYIHHIVRELKQTSLPATPQTVMQTASKQLLDASDPWSLGHYRDRLATYYPDCQSLVGEILDILAVCSKSMQADAVLQQMSSGIGFNDRHRLLQLLRRLEQDHYVKRDYDGYAWKFSLIAKWWRIDRDLGLPVI